MIVDCGRVGHQHCGYACAGQFGYRHRARATHCKVAALISNGHVFNVIAYVSCHARRGVIGAQCFHMARAGLVLERVIPTATSIAIVQARRAAAPNE